MCNLIVIFLIFLQKIPKILSIIVISSKYTFFGNSSGIFDEHFQFYFWPGQVYVHGGWGVGGGNG